MNLPTLLSILGLACYSTLIYVVVSSPVHTRVRVRRLFLISLVVMIAWQLSALVVSLARNERVAFAGYQVMTVVVVVFGVSYALFVRAFLMRHSTGAMATVGGALCVVTSLLVVAARSSILTSVYWNTTTQFYLPTFGPLAPVVGVPYYLLLGYVVFLLLQGYRQAPPSLIRSRIQYLLLGWCALLAGTLANFIPSLKDYPIDLMANVINAVLITYAIFRYQLLDISLVIRKGLAYSIPTTIIAISYFLAVFAVEKLLRAFVGYQVFLLALLVAALTAVAAQPLRDRAQLWVDQLFFREKYNAQLMLQELSELATSILDIDRLTSILLKRLTATMHIKRTCILLKEEVTGQYRLIASEGQGSDASALFFRRDHPIVLWMASHKEALSRYDMDVIPQFRALWVEERDELDSLEAQLFIPLIARGSLIGVLILGPKLSEIPYTKDEQLTLSTLTNQVAIAIENARLFGEAQQEIAERRRAEQALRVSQERYRSLFEESPIPLWEQDLSAVKVYLQNLRDSGVEDIRTHFERHPETVADCAGLVSVVSVNKAALEMYEAECVASLQEGLGALLDGKSGAVFRDELMALYYGRTSFESELVQQTLKGNWRDIDLRWSVAPGYEDTLSMVLVSTMDITERKEREETLRRRTARLELLREIDEAILESRSLDTMIDVALRRMRELLNCEGVGLVRLAIEEGHVSWVALDVDRDLVTWRGWVEAGQSASYRDSTILRGLKEGQVQVIRDLEAMSQLSPLMLSLQESGFRSIVLAPVARAASAHAASAHAASAHAASAHGLPYLVDTLVSLSVKPDAFGDEAMEVGLEVAHSLALAIRNAEMRREIRARAHDLEQQLSRVNLLNEITRAIAARHDLDSILRVVVQRLEENFTDQASIWLGEEDVYALAADGEQATRRSLEASRADRRKLFAEVPELQVLQQGQVAYVADLASLTAFTFKRLVGPLNMRSIVVVPLMVEGTVLGIVLSARREVDAFNLAERDFLGGLGEQVALAIHEARLHENLEAAYNELRETQRAVMQQERLRALGEMASGIAHDINNAISPVPLYTSLIEGCENLDKQARGYLGTIKVAVRDVEETVGRMRQFYRKREQEEMLAVDLNHATQQAIELTRPRWRDLPQEQGITIGLQTHFQRDLLPVMGNEGEIRQAVTNLILNAVDAMPDGGTLTLRTRKSDGDSSSAIVEVIDTGIGMGEETQSRAFEPFFSTKGARGSGMGLATVYGTMQRHNGDVQLESELGRGTTMRLIFPAQRVIETEVVPPPPATLPSLCILYVDDEPLLRDALKAVLEHAGHTVVVADGGQLGLEAFREAAQRGEPFDVVITDLGMPYVDGRLVARTVKQESPETPVILLTGWGQRLQAESQIPAYVDDMLCKPLRVDALTRALARAVSPD